ncbi:hypothetical protein [Planktomarina sp.]|uniref:hypothetical protein n=1 Tax=Planktomarina sp. TaxID=2024851 RepID=UPI0032615404
MKKPYKKAPVAEKEISLVKEEKSSIIQEVKKGDITKEGMVVVDIVDADRVLVSNKNLAKVIFKKDI